MNPTHVLVVAAFALLARTAGAQTESTIYLSPQCFDSLPFQRAHPCRAALAGTTSIEPGALYAMMNASLLADSLTEASRDSSRSSVGFTVASQYPRGACGKLIKDSTWVAPSIAVSFSARRHGRETQFDIAVQGSAVAVPQNSDGSSLLALCYLGRYDVMIKGPQSPDSIAPPVPSPPLTPIRPGTWTYSARIETAGNSQELRPRTISVSTLDHQDVAGWLVVMSTELEGRAVVDSVIMRRGDLTPVSRHAIIGPSDLMLVVDKQAAHGLLRIDTTVVPLNVPLGPRSFLNYYAFRAALAELPLKEGWTGQAAVLELAQQPLFAPLSLKVEGDERLSVPAGAFDCWRLAVSGHGINEHYWVAKQSGDVIRTREPIGDQGGILQLDLVSVVPHP